MIEHAVPGRDAFYQPTDVTWGPDGSVFVSDGYGNSRIAKFTKEGNFVKSWGERGTASGEFNPPHSIIIDKNNTLYVADRGNSMVRPTPAACADRRTLPHHRSRPAPRRL